MLSRIYKSAWRVPLHNKARVLRIAHIGRNSSSSASNGAIKTTTQAAQSKDVPPATSSPLPVNPPPFMEQYDTVKRRTVDPSARITSLQSNAYGWANSLRVAKEAPLWMLYEAEREEIPLRKAIGSEGIKKKDEGAVINMPMRDAQGRAYATGRRKTSTARVFVKLGDGSITVNGKNFEEYFPRVAHRKLSIEPLIATQSCGAFEITATITGGGLSGQVCVFGLRILLRPCHNLPFSYFQAGALKHGIAKALSRYDPMLKPTLRQRMYNEHATPLVNAIFLTITLSFFSWTDSS